jgi:hypothetical protein
MHRPMRTHRSPARRIAVGLAVAGYVIVLALATEVTGTDAAAASASRPSTDQATVAQADIAANGVPQDRTSESPLMTLAIAGAAVVSAAAWQLARTQRRPRPAMVRAGARRVPTAT